MSKPKRRALYPMPVDGLFGHPAYVSLPVAGIGMLIRLCEYYWRSGCAGFPRDDDQLFAIARAHRPTWRHWKPTILQIFSDIRPEMDGYHAQRVGGLTGMRLAAMGAAKAKLSARAKSLVENVVAPEIEVGILAGMPRSLPPKPLKSKAKRLWSD